MSGLTGISRNTPCRVERVPRPPTHGRRRDEHRHHRRYRDFCDSRLSHVAELVLDWISSAEFDRLLVDAVRAGYPGHEHERFMGQFRGLIGQWVRERGATAALSQ
jgi:hypothetical protein